MSKSMPWWGSLLTDVGGGIATGLLSNSRANEDRNFDREVARQRAFIDALGLDLKNREFQVDAPGKRARTSLQGDYLSSFKPPTFDRPAGVPNIQFQGGASISDNSRQLGGMVSQAMLDQQKKGDTFMTPEQMIALISQR